MSFTSELIEKVKLNQGFKSDYEVSKALGVDRQKISNWKNGRSEANAEATLQLMKLGGVGLDDALNLVTRSPSKAGGVLAHTAKQCILCKIKMVNFAEKLAQKVLLPNFGHYSLLS